MQAAKYDTEGRDLVEELQQLGMHQAAAEAIAQSYEERRHWIQDQLRAQRFRVRLLHSPTWYKHQGSSCLTVIVRPVSHCRKNRLERHDFIQGDAELEARSAGTGMRQDNAIKTSNFIISCCYCCCIVL